MSVLRDTGCSGIVVKKNLVNEEQYTGDYSIMLLIDNTEESPNSPHHS